MSEVEEIRPSWRPESLAEILSGGWKQTAPTLMERSDGIHLLYPGKVHSLHGESESAKSLIAQAECVKVINSGGLVLYQDYESDPASVVNRMLNMGATPDALNKKLKYVRPEFDPEAFSEQEAEEFNRHLTRRYKLIVIDGVTASFDVYGLNSMDNGDTMKWGRKLPLKLASATGAAVLLIDHVTKSSDGRGRFALGAQMKMSFLTGAAYTAKMSQQLAVGRVGKIDIRVGKDREGLVRKYSSDPRSTDQTAAIATAVFDSTVPNKLQYRLETPKTGEPTVPVVGSAIDAIVKLLSDGTRRSKNQIEKALAGTLPRAEVRHGLETAKGSGIVQFGEGKNRSTLHWLSDEDPAEDAAHVIHVDFSTAQPPPNILTRTRKRGTRHE